MNKPQQSSEKPATANKPLLKDPSLWIVVITLVGAANFAQFYYVLPWLAEKWQDSRPAPRIRQTATPFAGEANRIVSSSASPSGQAAPLAGQVNLDLSKKTYPWQKPRFTSKIMESVPPQVVLIRTEYSAPSGGWGTSQSNMTIGIRMSADFVLRSAYAWPNRQRMWLPDQMPEGQFDFIANLSTGALEALQSEIKKQWGLTAEKQMLTTNVLVLMLHHTNAPGLQPALRPTPSTPYQPGIINVHFQPLSFLTSSLEYALRMPIVDQTGLTGRFDIQLPDIPRTSLIDNAAELEAANKILNEHLGLELLKTNLPIEMLVVRKVQ